MTKLKWLCLFLLVCSPAWAQNLVQNITVGASGVVNLQTKHNSFVYFNVTLTANATTAFIDGGAAGAKIDFNICQDATGGRTWVWPPNFQNTSTITISTTASACTTAAFITPDGLTWNNANIGGGGGGTADPPVSANYTLTTTGAQTAINLTAAPIDTHTISWRPSPNPLGPAVVTDTFSYANGDLHAANANWVYQVGTFTVSSNAVYGQATLALAYRTDGPTSTANEWAQETVVETGVSGTQVNGPCVRMQTAASTAYCAGIALDEVDIFLWNAGALTVLKALGTPKTGDVIRIQATGTTISIYQNGILQGSVTDATIASGNTGIYSSSNTTANGATNFQSGTVTSQTCNIQLDGSPDGTNWNPGGGAPLIASQSCTSAGSFQINNTISNYVRVNVTTLTGITSLAIVYSGRLAPAAPNGGSAPVSNGQWIGPGQVLWAQYTSQAGVSNSGAHLSANILLQNGSVQTTSWDVGGGCTGASGTGTGFVVTQGGWLQGFTSELTTAGVPLGSVAVNLYILTQMPIGGGTGGCVLGALTTAQIGQILGTWTTGSFYPVSFIGTTSINGHPWTVPGYTTTLTQANPAAGAEFTFTASTSARSCIQSVSFTLVAGSTNVTPAIIFTINGSKIVYSAATAQTSGTTQTYSFSPGAGAEAVTGGATIFHIVPFNNGQLVCFNSGLSTGTISSQTNGLNGTTQYSAISFVTQIQQDNN